MITATLSIQYASSPLRKPRAWFIPGPRVEVWLQTIARWDIPHSSLRLLVLPVVAEDRRPGGVLVTVAGEGRGGDSLGCVPYGQLADNLFLPVEAQVDPEIDSDELSGLLSADYTYVWHPVSGLVAFEPAEELRVADLLEVRRSRAGHWDRGVPGIAVANRLLSLTPELPPDVESFLQGGQDDIGTAADSLDDLPPSPGERSATDVLERMWRRGARSLARTICWFAGSGSSDAGSPTRPRRPGGTGSGLSGIPEHPAGIGRLHRWAKELLERLNQADEVMRHKEVHRLLHMLEHDPDRGLRYALPCGNQAHRGLAPPADRLEEQDVDFDLRRLGAGGPADHWYVPPILVVRLEGEYRRLANRELRIGRHRRAAYIFAELLGDFDAAASALAAGHHWREAAIVYQKWLKQPEHAAGCLEQGGLWNEAIVLYEEIENFEKAGDLLRSLDQHDRAVDRYRQAVDQFRKDENHIATARVLDEKLNVTGEAIDELAAGWPSSSQSGECLRGIFRIAGRDGDQDLASRWIERMGDDSVPQRHAGLRVDILADTAIDYPDRTVRHQAAECTRKIVSGHLKTASRSDCQRYLKAIRRLAPGDRLLGRDCDRYADQYSARSQQLSRKPDPRNRPPELVQELHLPSSFDWRAMARCGETVFAAGLCGALVILSRWNFDGESDSLGAVWRLEPSLKQSPILLAINQQRDTQLLVHVVGGEVLAPQHTVPATDRFPQEIQHGGLRGMSRGVLAAARTARGVTWLVEDRNDSLVLVALRSTGETISTQLIQEPDGMDFSSELSGIAPVSLLALVDRVYVGLGSFMLKFVRSNEPEIIEFDSPIQSLAGSKPNTLRRIAVTFYQGGVVYWDHLADGQTSRFATAMEFPIAGFTRDGRMIAAGDDTFEVYSTKDRHLQLEFELPKPFPHTHAISVVASQSTNRFAIAYNNGRIAIYR